MSVQQNHYFMIGAKFGYKDFYSQAFTDRNANSDTTEQEERYLDSAFSGISHFNDLSIIADGMNGEYVVVGWILQKSGNYGSLNDYLDTRRKPSRQKVAKLILKEFNIYATCEYLAFTHYR